MTEKTEDLIAEARRNQCGCSGGYCDAGLIRRLADALEARQVDEAKLADALEDAESSVAWVQGEPWSPRARKAHNDLRGAVRGFLGERHEPELDGIVKLKGMGASEEQIAERVTQAAMLEASGASADQINVALKIFATGRITTEDLNRFAQRGINVPKHEPVAPQPSESDREAASAEAERIITKEMGAEAILGAMPFKVGFVEGAEWALSRAAAPAETEWEYGLLNPQAPDGGKLQGGAHLISENREHIIAQQRKGHPVIRAVRRRKAGPWLPVEGESRP